MSNQNRSVLPLRAIFLIATLGVAVLLGFHTAKAALQEARTDITDDLQRSLRLDNYTVVADSGAGRGEVIYFYKCWMCHNRYAKGGPYLQDLYKHPKLVSGEPVTDDTVSAKIKAGGAGMPAYRHTLTDADIADLRAYFRSGKCCVEGEDPPANPWYRAETNKWPVQSGLNGGASGVVKIKSGDSPEGVGVQLLAPNGVRTTVYTDGAG
jgi:mono/diheme cytochrome c family protein